VSFRTTVDQREGGCTGAGFRKGRSGNPGGRPRGLAKATRDRLDVTATQRGKESGADALVDTMIEFALDRDQDVRVRIEAIKWLADRGWGKVPSYMPVEADDPLEDEEERFAAAAEDFNREVRRLAALNERRREARPGA
jgi:Family of unknown function (DUF5681)